MKYVDLRTGTRHLAHMRRLFCTLFYVFPILFVLVGLYVVAKQPNASNDDVAFGLLLSAVAILEYINYFLTQLMYDNPADIAYLLNNKRLKPGLIAREFNC